MVERARNQKLDPVIGRDSEIRNVIRILSRKTKNNPVLIGEPGVCLLYTSIGTIDTAASQISDGAKTLASGTTELKLSLIHICSTSSISI